MLDFIGRRKEWEAIVLIPFINEVDTYTHTHLILTQKFDKLC